MKRLIVMSLALLSTVVFGTEYEWSQTAAGTFDWNDSVNWGNAGYPNAEGDTAVLTNAIVGAQTIDLNQETTIGTLEIGSPGASTFTIAGPATGVVGGNTLVFDAAGEAEIRGVGTATDVINADVELTADTTISAPGKALKFNGVVTAENRTINITPETDVYFQNNSNIMNDCVINVASGAVLRSYAEYNGDSEYSAKIYSSGVLGSGGCLGTSSVVNLMPDSKLYLKAKVDQWDTANTGINLKGTGNILLYTGRRTGGGDPGYIGVNSIVVTNSSMTFTGDNKHSLRCFDTIMEGTNIISAQTEFSRYPGFKNLQGSGEIRIIGGSVAFYTDYQKYYSNPYSGSVYVDSGEIFIAAKKQYAPIGNCTIYLGKEGGSSSDTASFRYYNSEWLGRVENDFVIVSNFNGTARMGGLSGGGGSFLGTITVNDDLLLTGDSRFPTFSGAIMGDKDITIAGKSTDNSYYTSPCVFSGTESNTLSGTITVKSGRLQLAKTGGAIAVAGDVVVGDGAGVYRRDGLSIVEDEQIIDTATVTVNSCGELTLFGYSNKSPYGANNFADVETFDTLWVNGDGAVDTADGRIVLGTDPGTGTNIIVNGGTLGGNGSIFETIDVLSGKIVPGYENMGTLTASNTLSLAEDAVCSFYISSSNNTMLVTTDELTLGGSVEVTAEPGFTPSAGSVYGVIKTEGSVSGKFETINAGDINGVSMKVSYTGKITDTEVTTTGGDDIVLYAMAGGTLLIIN